MATVFFNSGLLLVDIMPQGTTLNSDAYVATLKKLRTRLCRVQSHQQKQDVLLLHDSFPTDMLSHVIRKTTYEIKKLDGQH